MKAFLPLVVLASCTPEIESYKPLDVKPARDLDILFVLDDSGDRVRYGQMVAKLAELQSSLSTVDGQLPNLHVGVVTTDLGTSGTLDSIPVEQVGNCVGDGKGGRLQRFQSGITADYLEDLRGPGRKRTQNFASGDLALELGALMDPPSVGTGCEFEQPLEAMRRALDPERNPGFIRPDAMLAVVFLTSEDDCSLQRGAMLDPDDTTLGLLTKFRCTAQGVICDPDDPGRAGTHRNCRPREGGELMVDVSEYEAFLASYKPNRSDVLVSAVAGPRDRFVVRSPGTPVLEPSCDGLGGRAYPAVRIGALVDAFGGTLVDSCNGQDAAYPQITAPLVDRQASCFPTLRRSEMDACSVMKVTATDEDAIEQCEEGGVGAPCWYVYADPTACPDGDNLAIALNRDNQAPETGARIEARCFVK